MKLAMAILVAISFVGPIFADDKPAPVPDPEVAARIAAAQARLKAKTAAATQAANAALPDDPAALKAMILEQKQLIDALKVQVADLTREVAAAKNNGQAGAPEIAHRKPTRKPAVLPKTGYGFTTELAIDVVGYPYGTVLSVIDGSSAIVESSLSDPNVKRTLLVKGISTEGLADGSFLGSGAKTLPPCIITGTEKIGGTTYFVAEPIVQPGKTQK